MKRWMYVFTALTVTITLTVSSVGIASAEGGNPILNGLWAGSNFNIFGSQPKQKTTKQPQKAKAYAALGDSVAAGAGLTAVDSHNPNDARCDRSKDAYPKLVAGQLQAQVAFAACSGATAGDLVTKQAVSGPNIPAQLDTAFAHGTPNLITITAGANDVHWVDFIKTCYKTDCDNDVSSAVAASLRAAYKVKIRYVLGDIYWRSNGNPPPVLLTGYYSIGSDACLAKTAGSALTDGEIQWLDRQTTLLNEAIQSAADDFSFTTYVPLNFKDHGICSKSSRRWVQNLNDPAPFHPTARGQAAISRAVLDHIKH